VAARVGISARDAEKDNKQGETMQDYSKMPTPVLAAYIKNLERTLSNAVKEKDNKKAERCKNSLTAAKAEHNKRSDRKKSL
jgi:hypothetical protein